MENNNYAYLQQRLAENSISEEDNLIKIVDMDVFGRGEPQYVPVFDADPKGNITILYPRLDGGVYFYDNGNKNHPLRRFKRTRFKEPKITRDGIQKYTQPRKSGQCAFFTKWIIRKHKAKEKIKVLIITEGEFKAFRGCMAGLDVVGIPSIHGFYEEGGEQKLNEAIVDLIQTCQVEKVIFLTDADTLTVNFESVHEHKLEIIHDPIKDLYKRPNNFCSAVLNFREAIMPLMDEPEYELKDIYFAHIKTELTEKAKGLDDLLNIFPDKQEAIVEDLLALKYAKEYFVCQNISSNNPKKIRQYFGINNHDDFYKLYGSSIGLKPFNFRKRIYQFDGEKLIYCRHRDADEYVRIGDTYFRIVGRPNKFEELEEELVKWKKGEIREDYRKFPDFIDQIKR